MMYSLSRETSVLRTETLMPQGLDSEETGTAQCGEWRVTINQFSRSVDIRTQVSDGDAIICADLMHLEADQIVKAHNASMKKIQDLAWREASELLRHLEWLLAEVENENWTEEGWVYLKEIKTCIERARIRVLSAL